MAYLVKDLTALARQHQKGFYPDASVDDVGNLLGLSMVNETLGQLVPELDLFSEQTITILLTANVSKYAWDTDVRKVNAATWYDYAGHNGRILRETNVDEMDKRYKGWRTTQITGDPYKFYVQGTTFGLIGKPRQSSVLGYPCVRLEVVKAARVASYDDPLPPQLPNLDAFVFNLLWRWALREQDDQVEKYAGLARGSYLQLQKSLHGTLDRQNPQVVQSVLRIGR